MPLSLQLFTVTMFRLRLLNIILKQMADAGFRCYAPDWLGFGFSEKPLPKYDFDYTGL